MGCSGPEERSGLFFPEHSGGTVPSSESRAPGSASSVGQRTKSQPVQFQRRRVHSKGSTSYTGPSHGATPETLPGCSVSSLWNQSQLASHVGDPAGVAVPRPWYTLSSLSMRSEQGSTNQHQPALALLIIPQHQTQCDAQPKMHTVHVFCTSAPILSFLSDLWALYRSFHAWGERFPAPSMHKSVVH